MLQKRIAVGGSASNPPHLGHRDLVQKVWDTGQFDEVHWLVSGSRSDKPSLISVEHRFAMAQLNFANMRGQIIVDAEPEMTRPTIDVLRDYQRLYPGVEIIWYLGADHFAPKEEQSGLCDILYFWHEGKRLLNDFPFLIIQRDGYEIADDCLPRRYDVISQDNIKNVASSDARKNISRRMSNVGILHEDVIAYIEKYQLY